MLLRQVIGNVFRRLRRERGITLRELAELAQVSVPYLSEIERGRKEPSSEILAAICKSFGGGPVGLSTLATALHEEPDTIEDVYEPYLLQRGLIQRTPRGRAATARAYEHLGLQAPEPPGGHTGPRLFS